MSEQKCPKCGEMVEAVDLDRPADFYYCDCGYDWCDTQSYANRKADQVDFLRKARAEGR